MIAASAYREGPLPGMTGGFGEQMCGALEAASTRIRKSPGGSPPRSGGEIELNTATFDPTLHRLERKG